MRKNQVSKINPKARRIPRLDDDELPEEYRFERAKLKANRFAERVKFSHGGKRPGPGRKPVEEPVERYTITLYKSHVSYLRNLDANLSRAIRKLIAKSR